jgi:hypothetical protein
MANIVAGQRLQPYASIRLHSVSNGSEVGAARRLGRAGRLRRQRGQPGAGPDPAGEDAGDLPRWAHGAAD